MRQRSENIRKEEKNKRDGKEKWEKKDQKKLFLDEFQGTFALLIKKKYKLSCYNLRYKI